MNGSQVTVLRRMRTLTNINNVNLFPQQEKVMHATREKGKNSKVRPRLKKEKSMTESSLCVNFTL